ncbi:hypothetical protein BDA96_02G276500 [Sorghum bicolor]|uniref:Uncharacterized protein n=2 Tax=Sorghum bicolor TaxID=4558 RepID=A0A921RS30_SORBI|nr:hypothetical protein BDA96_02G276500 [Sorghum bicolor]KAG0544456.1 hypothetical protein BDA96_02G276500 [Sorghum bicolor]KXG36007.1 hypothetical protein SORBI_3002G263300 [Sorghum bicolor]OQU89771.1 hypothetical protein SORBI_3002G263300 [Sorghum bicolor]
MQMQHELRKDLDTAGFIPCLHCTSFTTDLNPTRSPSHLNRESRWPCWCLLLDEVHGFSFDSVVGDLRQWFDKIGSGLCEPDEDDTGIEIVITFLLPSRLSLPRCIYTQVAGNCTILSILE